MLEWVDDLATQIEVLLLEMTACAWEQTANVLVGPLGLVPTSARLFIQPKDHKSASDFPG